MNFVGGREGLGEWKGRERGKLGDSAVVVGEEIDAPDNSYTNYYHSEHRCSRMSRPPCLYF